ncbi:twin-arginine translocation signal domain-containing protein [Corynebacterium wankanglinii]|nr:twin-arginine translocation signal domain-containing protein [Corynebacterium wankanglinii]
MTRRQLLRATALGGATFALASCSPSPVEHFDVEGPPKRGGTLRVGLVGGSSTDTVDAHIPTSSSDATRLINMYDSLVRRDENYDLEYRLATAVEPSPDATEWTVTLREGVQFSDGRPVRPKTSSSPTTASATRTTRNPARRRSTISTTWRRPDRASCG